MSFSNNLRQLRKALDLSQEELAELLNISHQTVSKWEQGINYPRIERLLFICEKLNISPNELLDTKSAKNPKDVGKANSFQ